MTFGIIIATMHTKDEDITTKYEKISCSVTRDKNFLLLNPTV